MITLIEALNFRCLRYISQPLGSFHVLVGPNASGKTTFLDVVSFLGRLVDEGIDAAVRERTENFHDLLWKRSGESFELAIELRFPEELRDGLVSRDVDTIRYEVKVGHDEDSNEVGIQVENVLLKPSGPIPRTQRSLFPTSGNAPQTILSPQELLASRTTLSKGEGGLFSFRTEIVQAGKGEVLNFQIGTRRSGLGYLPESDHRFPVTAWLKDFLTNGVRQLILNSILIRRASPPGKSRAFQPDGSNLPWVVQDLERRAPEKIAEWIGHLQSALPDLEGIRTIERQDDRHRYLMLKYRGGLEIPSWMASDGTLRLLALTLPAYLPDLTGIYLIEEPENGIHPRAVETMYQSLSSVYDAQILLATHSPVILSLVEPDELLCFAKDETGATDIVLGSDHPALREWQGETNLSTLFAAGVLG